VAPARAGATASFFAPAIAMTAAMKENGLRIFLVRHGATEWSVAGRHTGRTDLALNPAGEAEARDVGARLSPLSFSAVFSSPLQRAARTCRLANLSASPVLDDDLREWHYGDFEGLTTKEILAARPGWNVFEHGCPGGESVADVSARADRGVARLRSHTGDVAVVSPGHFLRALAARWIELPLRDARRLYLSTASVSVLGFEHENPSEPVVLLWNDRSPTFT
jgi:probable phosphoglycerate mutase